MKPDQSVCSAGPNLNGEKPLWSTLTLIGVGGMVSRVREEKIYLEALRAIRQLKKNPGAPEVGVVRHELEEKKKTEYGSVIAFALEEAGL